MNLRTREKIPHLPTSRTGKIAELQWRQDNKALNCNNSCRILPICETSTWQNCYRRDFILLVCYTIVHKHLIIRMCVRLCGRRHDNLRGRSRAARRPSASETCGTWRRASIVTLEGWQTWNSFRSLYGLGVDFNFLTSKKAYHAWNRVFCGKRIKVLTIRIIRIDAEVWTTKKSDQITDRFNAKSDKVRRITVHEPGDNCRRLLPIISDCTRNLHIIRHVVSTQFINTEICMHTVNQKKQDTKYLCQILTNFQNSFTHRTQIKMNRQEVM